MNRRPSWSAPAHPLEDRNLLEQILLRLPPDPSYLPRAALVCSSWRDILLAPKFLMNFRKHHRKPPLLGFFDYDGRAARSFFHVQDRPNQLPYLSRFPLPQNFLDRPGSISFLGCRDGVSLLVYGRPHLEEAILWDPITGVHRIVAFPPPPSEFLFRSAAVRFSAPRNQHVDSNCQLHRQPPTRCRIPLSEDNNCQCNCQFSPFTLVLAGTDYRGKRPFTCIYESKSGVWGDLTSTVIPPGKLVVVFMRKRPSILVGDALH